MEARPCLHSESSAMQGVLKITYLFTDGHPLRLLAKLERRRDRKKYCYSILARLEFARFHISLNKKIESE